MILFGTLKEKVTESNCVHFLRILYLFCSACTRGVPNGLLSGTGYTTQVSLITGS